MSISCVTSPSCCRWPCGTNEGGKPGGRSPNERRASQGTEKTDRKMGDRKIFLSPIFLSVRAGLEQFSIFHFPFSICNPARALSAASRPLLLRPTQEPCSRSNVVVPG